MTRKLDLKRALGIGVATAAIAVTTAFAAPQLSQAATTNSAVVQGRGPGVGVGPTDTYLADALGITTVDLTAAQQKAYEAGIQQALDAGLITQAQADQLRNGQGRRGLPMLEWSGADVDHGALLADALGITTTQLTAAQQVAADARLAQAVTDGKLTQAQADMMKAEQALRQYIQDNKLYDKAVAAAVADGVITQAQADTILAGRTNMRGDFGRGGFGDFDGPRGGDRGGRGDFGRSGSTPGTQPPTSAPVQGSSS